MEFSQGVILVSVVSFFLFLVAAGQARLARKIDALAERLDDDGVRIETVLAPPKRDVRVHDFHSDDDEFQSVTARSSL